MFLSYNSCIRLMIAKGLLKNDGFVFDEILKVLWDSLD